MVTIYLALTIIFIGSALAIRGITWDEKARGIQKVTHTGYLSMLLVIVGFILSLVIVDNAHRDSLLQSEKLSSTVQFAESMRDEGNRLRSSLEEAKTRIEGFKSIIEVIRSESIEQPQTVISQYVELRPSELWMAPDYVYGGSIVKLYDFHGDILVLYGDEFRYEDEVTYLMQRCAARLEGYMFDEVDRVRAIRELEYCLRGQVSVNLVTSGRNGHSEIAIIGRSGRAMPWGIYNLSRRRDGGKVFVEATPHIRSEDWSWIEAVKDAVDRIEKIPPDSKIQVSITTLNMREQPSKQSPVVAKLLKSEELTVNKRKGLWLNVVSSSGMVGWVHGGYVTLLAS